MRPTRMFAAAATSFACFVAQGCSDDSTEPESTPCTAETGAVTATVTVGTSVQFDWSPRCAVALVLVEEDASDQWVVSTPEDSWTSADAANTILPPLTYGQAPAGTETGEPPATLVAGRTYELILWRVRPGGSNAQCEQRFENMCMLAAKQFTR